METKVNALVLRAADYNDNDKILTLLTAEKGKITAAAKGVKKAGAKLRFAAQPFCFAEYVLASSKDKYTVINATEQESFYDLRVDINKFYAASAAIEAAAALTFEGDECAEIFYALLHALTDMCNGDEIESLIKFLLFALKRSGYGISLDGCAVCGAELDNAQKLFYDLDAGSFTCENCRKGLGASTATYNVLKKADGKPFIEEHITDDGKKRALRLLREYVSVKLGIAFKSLSEYIRLI